MANVIVKSDERRRKENAVMKSYGVTGKGTAEQREAASVIVARSEQVVNMKEGKRYA